MTIVGTVKLGLGADDPRRARPPPRRAPGPAARGNLCLDGHYEYQWDEG